MFCDGFTNAIKQNRPKLKDKITKPVLKKKHLAVLIEAENVFHFFSNKQMLDELHKAHPS